jgi:cytochrome c oxidase assembly protein Cox11
MLQTVNYLLKGYAPWTPTKYKPYAHGQLWDTPDFITHTNEVYIILGNDKYKGSFYCTKNWCEIITRKIKMIVPIKNVKFYRKIICDKPEFENNHVSPGEKCNIIIALVKKYGYEDIKRWTRWKKK